IYLFLNFKLVRLWKFWFWGVLVMMWLATFFGFFAEKNALLGGTIGFETNDFLQDYIGFAGTILLLTFVLIAYLALRFKLTPELFSKYFKRSKKEVDDAYAGAQNVSDSSISQ